MSIESNDQDRPPDVPQSDPVPPEVIAELIRTFDEQELLRELREMKAGQAYKLEDFIGELEEIGRRASGDR